MKTLTILTPAFNEEAALPVFFETMEETMKGLNVSYQYLVVNDGSVDNTVQVIKDYANKLGNVSYISFSRNFGKEACLMCGLRHIKTDGVVLMDCDLQHPPSLIKPFIEKWNEGYDLVYGLRKTRKDPLLKKFFANIFYRVFNIASKRPMLANMTDFALIDKKVVAAIAQFEENPAFIRGVYVWAGFKNTTVAYEGTPRCAGYAKYSFFDSFRYALDGFLNCDGALLRWLIYFGFFTAFCAFVYGAGVLCGALLAGYVFTQVNVIIFITLLIGGLNLFAMGIVGEYLSRILKRSQNKPLYIIAAQSISQEMKP